MGAAARADQHQLVFRVIGGHAVNQPVLGDLQRIAGFRRPMAGRWPGLCDAQHRNGPGAMIQYHQQAAARRQVDHVGQMAAGGRDPEVAASEHQRGTVFIRLGSGVQPVSVGGAFDVRWA
ncbi:hypothetical protein D3C76_1045740 [compost metagenome]